MPTNVFFDNFAHFGEQNLLEDLVIESIKIYGLDCYYLPRTQVNFDELFIEDVLHKFDDSFQIEMYIKNVDGFAGDGDLMSRFGLEIRDRMTLCVARRRFSDDIAPVIQFNRPREGDVIFLPMVNNFYEIKYVEHEAVFYQMGSLQFYELVVEMIEYNSERFNTEQTVVDNADGLAKELDLLDIDNNIDVINQSIQTEDGDLLGSEDGGTVIAEEFDLEDKDPIAQNQYIQNQGNDIIDFSEDNPFGEP